MLLTRFLILIVLFITISRIFAADYYVYYLGGQSNMDGYGYTDELPDSLNQELSDVMTFHGNTASDNLDAPDGKGIWVTLRPGHEIGFSSDGKENSYSERLGPELTFARQLSYLYPARNIAIIKYSRGGTSIDCNAAGKFGCWDPDFQGKTGINQYDHFLATLRFAMSLSDIDVDGETDRLIPAGILWMQGESDASYTEDIALRYYDHLKRLMDLIRAALQTDDLTVVIGIISDSWNDEED